MAEIIQHMNTDHKDALVLLAREFAGVESEEATMTAVDRLGFHLRLKTQYGIRGARIAFLWAADVEQSQERIRDPDVISAAKVTIAVGKFSG